MTDIKKFSDVELIVTTLNEYKKWFNTSLLDEKTDFHKSLVKEMVFRNLDSVFFPLIDTLKFEQNNKFLIKSS